jgi:uncharacterized protein (DUF1697 family)
MRTWVALLRGVNVSGANRLPMAEFRALLGDIGCGRAETYIQSGNAVFDSAAAAAELEPLIRDGIAARFGFAPETFVLPGSDLDAALSGHPFSAADPARVHVFFLRETPDILDEAGLRALAGDGDAWVLAPGRFTLHTPAGIGRSKLADRLHRFLPGHMTARNLRTLAALADLVLARG